MFYDHNFIPQKRWERFEMIIYTAFVFIACENIGVHKYWYT